MRFNLIICYQTFRAARKLADGGETNFLVFDGLTKFEEREFMLLVKYEFGFCNSHADRQEVLAIAAEFFPEYKTRIDKLLLLL